MNIDKTFIGLLGMDDNGEFILQQSEDGKIVNITKILDDIFSSSLKPQVYIKITRCGRLLFEEDGLVTINVDEDRVESHYICGNNLDKLLFYETDNMLEISIKKRGKFIKNGNKS